MNDVVKKKFCLINTLIEAVDHIKTNEETYDKTILNDIKDALMSLEVNENNNMIKLINKIIEGENCYSDFYSLFDKWFSRALKGISIDDKMSVKNNTYRCDNTFLNYINFINDNTEKDLFDYVLNKLKLIKENDIKLYELLTVGYRGWYFPGNWLDGFEGENNSLITNRVKFLKNNINDLIWLYNNVSDITSRNCINALLDNWLTFSMESTFCTANYAACRAVDNDIFSPDDDEVFVDCGTYIGDTIAEYVNVFNRDYKRIYAYDISKETIEILKNNLASLTNIEYRWKGVSDKNGSMKFVGVNAPFEGNHLLGDKETYIDEKCLTSVEIVKLDDDIKEEITFLKIDCEGVDKEALIGAKNHIVASHPKISIDAGHKIEDVTEVPKLLKSIDSSYRIFLRPLVDLKKPVWFLCGFSVFAI